MYIFSEKEIDRNVQEIREAFAAHPKTRIFYASKACSVMAILRIVKELGIGVETNSLYERVCNFLWAARSRLIDVGGDSVTK